MHVTLFGGRDFPENQQPHVTVPSENRKCDTGDMGKGEYRDTRAPWPGGERQGHAEDASTVT